MHNEDTDEEISCPYCNQTDDCPHLLATIDRTFGEIGNGYACGREEELTHDIEKAFMARALSGEISSRWSDDSLNELWNYAIAEFNSDEPDIFLETVPLFDLISNIFDDAGAMELEGVFEGAPGLSSVLSSHYCEDPKASFDRALNILKNRLLNNK